MMGIKISLTGDVGSGKSTVANLILEKWPGEYYGTGVIAREIASSMNMDIEQFNVYSETHPEIDKMFDDRLIALSDDERNLIIDSRMAWHFTKGTFKVYLSTDPKTSATRIMAANRSSEHFETIEEAVASVIGRKESEKKRYFELYHVHCKDLSNYDLVIDTSDATAEQVAEVLWENFQKWQQGTFNKTIYVCPKRLHFKDTGADMDLSQKYATKLEYGETLDAVYATFQNEHFYITKNEEVALAYTLNMNTFVPVKLDMGMVNEQEYIAMEDSL